MKILIWIYLLTAGILLQCSADESILLKQSRSIPDQYQSVNVIDGEFIESRVDLSLSGAHSFDIKRWSGMETSKEQTLAHGWAILPLDLFTSTKETPQENVLSTHKMVYDYDSANHLKGIQCQSLDGKTVYNGIKLTYVKENSLAIDTLNGQQLTYEFITDKNKRKLLSKVKAPGQPETRYTYQDHAYDKRSVIATRIEPQGRSVQIEYFTTNDFALGKVKSLKAPIGSDGSLVTSARFVYRAGVTEVYDALGYKTVYTWNINKQLISIESQHPDGKSTKPYRTFRFYWDNGKLISKTLEDSNKSVLQCETYQYDTNGRLYKETLWGNLSGENPGSIRVDKKGFPQGNNTESYSKIYTFSTEESGELLSIKEDNGKETRFSYHPTLKLMESQQTVFQNQILQREFYQYDEQGHLIRTIMDDGKSYLESDLKGVTERRITEITSYAPFPNPDLPQTIEEKYYDLKSGSEKTLRKMINTYSSEGWLVNQEIFDGAGKLQQHDHTTYDSEGRPLVKTNLEGKSTTYTYDALGNPIRRTSSEDQVDTNFVYDYSNRLIRQEELSTDGKLKGITNRYNLNGNKIAVTDSCGNTTENTFDALGRLSSVTLPAVLNSEGNTVRYKTQYEYDIFDRVIKTIAPENSKTEIIYNIRGKPTRSINSDGSEEKAIYNLDGTIKESTDRKGNKTVYQYDGFGHTIDAIVTQPSGQILQHIRSTYAGSQLISTEDLSGIKISYTYDGAGRLIREEQGSRKVEQEYDDYGQISIKKEWYGADSNDYRSTVTERDELNQIKRVYIQDSDSKILIERNSEKDSKVKSPYSESESIVANDRNQLVWQSTVADPQGMLTITTLDALSRTEKIIKKDPYGQVIALTEYRYDASGNTCKEIHQVISPNGPERTFIIAKRWGSNKQLNEIVEGEGTRNQKITRYTYNSQGLLETIIKPDGTSILHEYNDLGQLTALDASDNSFGYSYTYDSTGNIVSAEDKWTEAITLRTFDEDKHLVAETLGNGLKSLWSYDRLGRLTHSDLPDLSTVDYRYDAANLLEIKRSVNGKSYTHSYTYDHERGRVIEAELMGNSGKLTFEYNEDAQPINLQTPFWSQHITADGRDKLGRIRTSIIEDPLGLTENQYNYDSLSRLTQEKGLATNTYTYDSIDNRLSHNKTASTLNSLNHLTRNGETSYTYDPNGNVIVEQISGQPTKHYAYDALNRLMKVTIGSKEAYLYAYDPFNRRISKTLSRLNDQTQSWEDTETENYLYYGDHEIGSATPQGAIKQFRVLGVGIGAEIGASVLLELNGSVYVPIHDIQGSVRCLIDVETQQVAEFYRYTAFGETTFYNGANEILSESAVDNPWLFSSKRLDSESGLYFYGKRYYAPELGRWFTPDPLGFADGANLYAYVHQNPLNSNDLYGLYSFSDLWNDIRNFFSNCIDKLKELFQTVGNWVKSYLNPSRVREYFRFIGYEIIGKGFALLKGGSNFRSYSGVYGQGELNDKVRISFINGIYTEPTHLEQNVETISKTHGGINVHYVYSASRGLILDFIRAARVKFGFTSPEAHILADTWRQMIAEMGGTDGGGTIVHYAHSIGAGDTERALGLMTQEERQMIEVSTFGSPILLQGGNSGHSIVNYVNVNDCVSFLDPIRYLKALFSGDRSIMFVGSISGFPFIDHLFAGPVYSHLCETLGKYFLQIYGV